MKVASVLISFIPVLVSIYILWHVHTCVPSVRLRFAKTRGYLAITSMFAVTTIYWYLVVVAPEEFGYSNHERFSVPWTSSAATCGISLLLTIMAFHSYKANRPQSKAEGRSMAGW